MENGMQMAKPPDGPNGEPSDCTPPKHGKASGQEGCNGLCGLQWDEPQRERPDGRDQYGNCGATTDETN